MQNLEMGIFLFIISLSWITIGVGRYIYLLDKKDD